VEQVVSQALQVTSSEITTLRLKHENDSLVDEVEAIAGQRTAAEQEMMKLMRRNVRLAQEAERAEEFRARRHDPDLDCSALASLSHSRPSASPPLVAGWTARIESLNGNLI